MAFIRDLTALFRSKHISVEIDPLLLPHLVTEDKTTTSRNISFNLYRLIYHIGTIQSRRFATSNRLKFLDKTDLIEKIYHDVDDFRIRISDIRNINGSETLTSISEDFGIGISVAVAERLFGIRSSTIQKIYGTGRRPDWKCQLSDQRTLVAEGKGATSIQTSNSQELNALDQKTREPADIQIASLTLLKENETSQVRLLDPPAAPNNLSPEMENHILRAGHYASVFSFLGNSKLSMYYSQMRKRLEGMITPEEQNLKNQTFHDLQVFDPTVQFMDHDFVGSFFNVEDDRYIFVGVDKRLLSFQGFITYNDFSNDVELDIAENHYFLYHDGILLIEISNIQFFGNIVQIDRIPNYQENITISDIDEMTEISFSKYFTFILKQNGFDSIEEETVPNRMRFDMRARRNGETYYFEFKIRKNKRIDESDLQNILSIEYYPGQGTLVLVTNAEIENRPPSVIVIARQQLATIAKDSTKLLEMLE